ncbi:CCT motif family protein [Striga hermonthica]|uniref:CCT motif family protein n=1 Tax=Striga hermonthica TaxID=68872 RepID=A0A9N7MQ20_STRHE|nr:CCT motif family protein [Striga hermonthica]
MSYDLFAFENSFFSDTFPTFTADQAFGFLQEIHDEQIQENVNPVNEMDQMASDLLDKTEYSMKTEECQVSLNDFSGFENCSSPKGFDGAYTGSAKFIQRSYSSNFEDKTTRNIEFQPQNPPQLGSVWESQNLQRQILSSPVNGFSGCGGQMRRVCSAGDLQKAKSIIQTRDATLSTEKSSMEDSNFKVGRYSAEERKERIDRYRAKRTQRNFNKTIKYACRKTLADNRPRIRGRFARNDELGEIPKASIFHRYEDEDDVWIEGFEYDNGLLAHQRGMFFNIAGSSQCQNYSL